MKRSAYMATKWISRLGLVVFLMSNALYWGASRAKFGDLNWALEDADALQYPYVILNNPLFMPALHLAFTISSAITIWLVADVKYGHRLPQKAAQAWLHFTRTWFVVLPVLALIYWTFSGNLYAMLLGLPWIWATGMTCFFIVIQQDKKPVEYLIEEQDDEDDEEPEEEHLVEAA